MTPYSVRTSRKTLFIGFFLSGCILLLIPHNVTSKLHLCFAQFLGGPLRLGRVMTLSAREPAATDTVSAQQGVQWQDQIRQLNNSVDYLQGLLEAERQQVEQLQGLRRELSLKRKYLVGSTALTNSNNDQITIDRGSSDGIMSDLYAICDAAVIGRVHSVSSHRSVIELISHPQSLLTVRIAKQTTPVTLAGSGDGHVKIIDAQYDDPVKVHDPVYLLANDALAEGVLVGRIKSCQRDEHQGLLWDIQVEPATDLNQIRSLAVAVPMDWLGQ